MGLFDKKSPEEVEEKKRLQNIKKEERRAAKEIKDSTLQMKLVGDLPNIIDGSKVTLYVGDANLEISHTGTDAKINLPLEKIHFAEIKPETEIINEEKDKSVIGRGVVGGVLFGPVGAIVGGMSGTGKKRKKKEEITNFLVINYMSGDELKALIFEDLGTWGTNKFVNILREKAGIVDGKKKVSEVTL